MGNWTWVLINKFILGLIFKFVLLIYHIQLRVIIIKKMLVIFYLLALFFFFSFWMVTAILLMLSSIKDLLRRKRTRKIIWQQWKTEKQNSQKTKSLSRETSTTKSDLPTPSLARGWPSHGRTFSSITLPSPQTKHKYTTRGCI